MKRFVSCLVVMFTLVCLAACGGGNDAVPTPTPAPTVVPSLMKMGYDGAFEDVYLTATFPTGLVYQYSPEYNCAVYQDLISSHTFTFSYLPEEYLDYEEEFGHHNRTSYADFVWETWGGALEAFKYTEVDGHEAIRTLFTYTSDSGITMTTLAYHINVDGWSLTLFFTTDNTDMLTDCDKAVKTIRFKDGY